MEKYVFEGDGYETETEIIYYFYDESGAPVYLTYEGTTLYYVKNLQGDITGLMTADGTIVISYEYDAWGNVIEERVYNSGYSRVRDLQLFRYRGYIYDGDTGLYYLQSRYYDPTVGRFINADDPYYLGASGTVLSYNLYAYCENNCVNSLDPFGNYILYIYDSEFYDCVVNETKLLQKKYEVRRRIVRNTATFTEVWNTHNLKNGKVQKIDIVILALHGTYSSLTYVNFSKLVKRNIDTLIILSCNAGHYDYKSTNPASKFIKNHNIRQVIACDGVLAVGKSWGKYYYRVKSGSSFTGVSNYTRGRKPYGFMVYTKDGKAKTLSTYYSSIIELLKAIGKW